MDNVYIVVSKFIINNEDFYKILSVWDSFDLALEEAVKWRENGYINVKVHVRIIHGEDD